MLKLIRVLLVTMIVSMFFVTTALAADAPIGGCPKGFMLHMAGEHDEHHADHLMVGSMKNKNGDAYICVNHVTPRGRVHVHIDNNVKLGVSR